MSDFLAVLIWWLLLQAMGWAALPLLFRLLRWLPDRGYSVAKPAGLLLGNYVLWLFGSLGWLRDTEGGILVAFALVAMASTWAYRRWDDGPKLIEWIKSHRAWVIAYELVFLIALAGWAIFRAHNPDLSSTEKPMEFAFMNAIRRAATFPPPDPWLSGFAISYYYFGYVMMSTLTQLSGVASGVAFGLSNALWFALTAAGAFGIAANLAAASKRAAPGAIVATGLLGALFVPVLGNFEGPLEVAHANAIGSPEFWRWLDIQDINTPPVPKAEGELRWPACDANGCVPHPRSVSGWWWWRASRVVHDYPLGSNRSNPAEYQELIDEFPFFSFLLGDMHPHVLALPYALMSLALAFNLYRLAGRDDFSRLTPGWKQWFWGAAPIVVTYPIFLGGLSFLNTWDFPIHVFIAALAWTLGRWVCRRQGSLTRADEGRSETGPGLREVVGDGVAALVACGLIGAVAYAPFYVGFRSQAAGIAPNLYNPTALQQFFVMFGPFLLIGGAFILTLLIRAVRHKRLGVGQAALGSVGGGAAFVVGAGVLTVIASVIVVVAFSGVRKIVDQWMATLDASGISLGQVALARIGDFGVPLLLGVVMAAIVLILRSRPALSVEARAGPPAPGGPPWLRWSHGHGQGSTPEAEAGEETSSFALMLFFVGALLAFAVEFVFLIDFFGTRMNTVFKLYYQAWAVWGVASAYAVYYLWQSSERLKAAASRIAFAIVVIASVAAGMVYPLLTIRDKVDLTNPPTLDARAPTRQFSPDEVAAIDWLDQNAVGLPVVLEAEGQSYRDATSRVSAWTGLPGVLGWVGHEGQWRGTYDDVTPRQPDIDRIYTTTDAPSALALLRKYDVAYVFVGANERQKYPPNGLAKFAAMLDVAFQSGDVTLYRVRE